MTQVTAVLTGYSSTWLGTSSHEQLRQQLTAKGKRCRIQVGVSSRQVRIGVIPRLVIVVLDIEVLHLAVVDAQCAAGIVDVLAIERLHKKSVEISFFVSSWRNGREGAQAQGIRVANTATAVMTSVSFVSQSPSYLYLRRISALESPINDSEQLVIITSRSLSQHPSRIHD